MSDLEPASPPTAAPPGPPAPPPSLWLVLREQKTFRAIWLAGLVSLVGSWMQNLGAAWLMTEISTSPALVSLVQTAQALPALTFALIAGALADMFDRRRYLIAVMTWQIILTAIMAGLTAAEMMTPWLLLALIYAVGVGNAFQVPAMSANLQEIVPRDRVIGAVTLNAISMNFSRAVGPGLAGILIAATGVAIAFVLNSLSYLVYLIVLAAKVPRAHMRQATRQSFYDSFSSGILYARRAKRFQAVLIRGFSYFLFSSIVMGLLPVLARQELGVEAGSYGRLVGFIGVGALVSALLILPQISHRFSRDNVVLVTGGIVAACIVVLGSIHSYEVFAVTLFVFGGAWTISMMSFQVSAQMALPGWVRGRGISMSMTSFMAGVSVGGVLWGQLAHFTNLSITFQIAGVGLILVSALTHRFKISSNETDDA